MSRPSPNPATRPRLAILSYSFGEYDARSLRVARSAIAAGYDVTMYARWLPGMAPVEERDGYRLIRVDTAWQNAVPGLRRGARARATKGMAEVTASVIESDGTDDAQAAEAREPEAQEPGPPAPAPAVPATSTPVSAASRGNPIKTPLRLARRGWRGAVRKVKQWWSILRMFPMRPLGWSFALAAVAEPADIWHGMWAGSLPALARMRRLHGGRTIYDSRDVYMLSREFSRLEWPIRPMLAALERRWAHKVDSVLTVNEAYADLVARQLGVARPPVVLNTPERWTAPVPAPDLIRQATGVPAGTAVVLYQGQLNTERGIEESMEAILLVPDAVLVLLGFGPREGRYRSLAATPRYAGRVIPLPPVPPSELLAWTASADVMVMAIQPTTINHHYTTPQKLWEALAAGVPVVASDMPGMAEVVRATGAGILCDPTSPVSIAESISAIVTATPEKRAALRERALAAAHGTYNWEAQVGTLLELYRELLAESAAPRPRG